MGKKNLFPTIELRQKLSVYNVIMSLISKGNRVDLRFYHADKSYQKAIIKIYDLEHLKKSKLFAKSSLLSVQEHPLAIWKTRKYGDIIIKYSDDHDVAIAFKMQFSMSELKKYIARSRDLQRCLNYHPYFNELRLAKKIVQMTGYAPVEWFAACGDAEQRLNHILEYSYKREFRNHLNVPLSYLVGAGLDAMTRYLMASKENVYKALKVMTVEQMLGVRGSKEKIIDLSVKDDYFQRFLRHFKIKESDLRGHYHLTSSRISFLREHVGNVESLFVLGLKMSDVAAISRRKLKLLVGNSSIIERWFYAAERQYKDLKMQDLVKADDQWLGYLFANHKAFARSFFFKSPDVLLAQHPKMVFNLKDLKHQSEQSTERVRGVGLK